MIEIKTFRPDQPKRGQNIKKGGAVLLNDPPFSHFW